MPWIKVEDRLPVDYKKSKEVHTMQEVIVFDGEEVFVTEFHTGQQPEPWCYFIAQDITHWMPLPDAPRQ